MSRCTHPINEDYYSSVSPWRGSRPTTRSRPRVERERKAYAEISSSQVFEESRRCDRPSSVAVIEPRPVTGGPATPPSRHEQLPRRGWEPRAASEISDVGHEQRVAGSVEAHRRDIFRQPERLHRYCPTCGRITVETTRRFGAFMKLPPDDTERACWLCRDDVFVGSINTEAVDALTAIADAL